MQTAEQQVEFKAEQQYLDALYARLEELRVRSEAALVQARATSPSGTPAARTERDAFVALHSSRVAQLNAAEDRLCFGRLDLLDGERRYVGRIGLADEVHRQLLIDWRAPAAEPFYGATAFAPGGVVRRRHLSTKARTITGVEDDVLDAESFDEHKHGPSIVGDGALLLALNSARGAHMRDIVGTIQAEQDQIIRAPMEGILVVQGAPGTGKTAVALHRTAYLLYTHRNRIAARGVLIIGPNTRFLSYIDQVLPSLGEVDAALLRTPGQLYPGIEANFDDEPETAAIKGDLRMVGVIERAVKARQRIPRKTLTLRVDGITLTLAPHQVLAAARRATATGKPHNQARVSFVKQLLNNLADQLMRNGRASHAERSPAIEELRDSADVRRELNLCWPPISPERLLRDLYAKPDLLASVGSSLSKRERELLARERKAPWTIADIALLDEAAELLGDDDSLLDRKQLNDAEAERQVELGYARDALSESEASSLLSAEDLADRHAGRFSAASVAALAAEDRQWAFGHVVIDEAQELSPMMWRLVLRRCPSRSMTVVGDVAQTSARHAAKTWSDILAPHLADRWRSAELTVNYRTPQQFMNLATDVLRAGGYELATPSSPRVGRFQPVFTHIQAPGAPVAATNKPVAATNKPVAATTDPELSECLTSLLEQALSETEGTVAVLTSRAAHASTATAMAQLESEQRVSIMTVTDAKGLEFDAVLIVQPADIVAESPRGLNDLYVALTRATQQLYVLFSGALPAGFSDAQAGSCERQAASSPRVIS